MLQKEYKIDQSSCLIRIRPIPAICTYRSRPPGTLIFTCMPSSISSPLGGLPKTNFRASIVKCIVEKRKSSIHMDDAAATDMAFQLSQLCSTLPYGLHKPSLNYLIQSRLAWRCEYCKLIFPCHHPEVPAPCCCHAQSCPYFNVNRHVNCIP